MSRQPSDERDQVRLARLIAIPFAIVGQLTIGFAALLIGGLPSILLLMDDKPTGPGPGDAGGRQS